MARPRTYDASRVIEAARDAFWEHGYKGTSIGDLEAHTGLNRSSIYQMFGSKRGLFDVALDSYLEEEFETILGPLQQPGAELDEIVAFFAGLAQRLRSDPMRTARGCLMVNTIAELSLQDAQTAHRGSSHLQRLHTSFATALTQATERQRINADVARRARLLCATTLGIFVTAKVASAAAAEACDAAAAEVSTWRSA